MVDGRWKRLFRSDSAPGPVIDASQLKPGGGGCNSVQILMQWAGFYLESRLGYTRGAVRCKWMQPAPEGAQHDTPVVVG